MADQISDLEQREKDVPGFKDRYDKNFREITERRLKQGVTPINLDHIHYQAFEFTEKDIDPVTEVLKREVIMEVLKNLAAEIATTQEEVTLAFVDLNRLGKINNEMGHRAGDMAMNLAGKAVKKSIRETDLVGKYGGDELIVAFRNSSLNTAEDLITDRLIPNTIEGITFSIGLSKLHPKDLKRSLEEADQAMYQAKKMAHKTNRSQLKSFDSLNATRAA